ncbi:MAG: dockerin type I repeat-containing protein [Clostridia bacterium]|nr:dockerin type I repeat-containing protein [Clostridia bacterium]
MKLFCKKAIIFLLVALMMSTTCFSGVLAQEVTVEGVTAKIEALPEYEDFSAVTDEGLDKALEDAREIIIALASLSDEDFELVTNSAKVFDLYVGLSILKMREGMPAEIPQKEEVVQQLKWAYENSIVTDTDALPLELLLDYTSPVESEDPDLYDTFGGTLYSDYSTDMLGVISRITAVLTTMTEDEVAVLGNEAFSWILGIFPEQVTIDNFWDYATAIYDLKDIVGLEVNNLEGLSQELVAKYQALVDSFDSLVQDERPFVIEQLDSLIAQKCDVEAATASSTLALTIYHEPICDALFYKIDLLSMLYEEDACDLLSNYDMYSEYESVVYAWDYDYIDYGDLNEDYEVDAKDALMVLKVAVGKIEIDDYIYMLGDVDGNGDLDAKDALYILKYAVGKIEYFPVEDVLVEQDFLVIG